MSETSVSITARFRLITAYYVTVVPNLSIVTSLSDHSRTLGERDRVASSQIDIQSVIRRSSEHSE